MVLPGEIAQASDISTVFFWSLLLILLLVGALVGALQLKKRLTQAEEEEAPPAGFTLADLRELHRNGQMTAEEFEKAKGKIVAAAKAAALRQEEPKTAQGDGPARPGH